MSAPDDSRRRIQDFLKGVSEEAAAEPVVGPRAIPNFVTAGIRIPSDNPQVGKYRLLRPIGRGGMGTVYEAEDQALGRKVALKVLRDGHVDPKALERFHREAAILARFRHPNLVPIHEVGKVDAPSGDPTHFIAMGFVEGHTLGDLLVQGQTPRAELLRIMEEVCRVVGFAHLNGVIHRDLKPANIMVDGQGRVVLMDFGLAHSEFFHSDLTGTRAVMGTPGYMSPEQVRGKTSEIDRRTDVYALGAILYEVLVGRIPFPGQTPADVYNRILDEEPERPSRLAESVPPDLERIALKALEKDPARRYQEAVDMADDLARFRRGEPVDARRSSVAYRLTQKVRRRKSVAISTLVSTVILATTFFVVIPALVRQREQREREAQTLHRRLRESFAAALRSAVEARRTGTGEAPGPFDAAREEFGRLHPESPEPFHLQGRVMRARLRIDEALRLQEEALRLDPSYAPALYERAVLTALRRRRSVFRPGPDPFKPFREGLPADLAASLEEDLSRLNAILNQEFPTLSMAEIDMARGLLASVRAQREKARQFLASAIAQAPRLEEAYEALAELESQAGNPAEAVRWLTLALGLDDAYPPFREARGSVHLRWALELIGRGEPAASQFESAAADFEAAAAQDADLAPALRALADRCRQTANTPPRK